MKKIELSRGLQAIVDDKDYDCLSQWKWSALVNNPSRRYVVRGCKGKLLLLHRFIMKPPKGMVVDHINGDGLDNRRSNLRVCTVSQNGMNRGAQKNNRTGLKGVNYIGHLPLRPWWARIGVNKKYKSLGFFATKEEAHEAYEKEAKKLFGEFYPTVSVRTLSGTAKT